MRHSAWKENKRRVNNRAGALLILHLAILIPLALRTILPDPRPSVHIQGRRIAVQVEGEVEYPGVYYLDTICDLPEFVDPFPAGILRDIPLQPGMKLTFQRNGNEWQVQQEEISAFHKITLGIPLSLNKESGEGLTAVPGIGPGLADIILKGRNKRGGFKSIEEIKSLYGVGERAYNKMIPYLILD
jgi:competence protein ComEA